MKIYIGIKKTACLGPTGVRIEKNRENRLRKKNNKELKNDFQWKLNRIDLFELIVLFDDIFMRVTPSPK